MRKTVTLARGENLTASDGSGSGRSYSLPTWYDPSVGPELRQLAQRGGLSINDVIERHSGHEYQVFVPGFAFMGLVEEILASPRLNTPRKRVAAGSVGIAERQTAAYPQASPGGWNLIGRTTAKLFDHSLEGYSLLQPGDRVRLARYLPGTELRLSPVIQEVAQEQHLRLLAQWH